MYPIISEDLNYTTKDEFRFMSGIHSLEVMNLYWEGLTQRRNWRGLDEAAILAAAARRLTSFEVRQEIIISMAGKESDDLWP